MVPCDTMISDRLLCQKWFLVILWFQMSCFVRNGSLWYYDFR